MKRHSASSRIIGKRSRTWISRALSQGGKQPFRARARDARLTPRWLVAYSGDEFASNPTAGQVEMEAKAACRMLSRTIITMILISLQPFAFKKIALLVAALLCLSSAICLADSLFVSAHSARSSARVGRVQPLFSAAIGTPVSLPDFPSIRQRRSCAVYSAINQVTLIARLLIAEKSVVFKRKSSGRSNINRVLEI